MVSLHSPQSYHKEGKYMRIADMHCDTISELLRQRREHASAAEDTTEAPAGGQSEGAATADTQPGLGQNTCHVDLRKMQKSGYVLQNFALFVNLGKVKDAWQEVQKLRALYEEELQKNQDIIAPVYSYADIEKNLADGKMSAMLTVEEGGVCGGRTERLRELYKQGVRMMTLSWNYKNELGHPNLYAELRNSIRAEEPHLTPEEQDYALQKY